MAASKRRRGALRHTRAADEAHFLELPAEMILEICDELPPLERLCFSQVCRHWRQVTLSAPRVWTQLALVGSPRHSTRCKCRGCHPERFPSRSTSPHTVYDPRPNSNNLLLFDQLVQRSGQLPLDLTIIEHQPVTWDGLKPHSQRIARIHFSYDCYDGLSGLLRVCDNWPALRTLTAGFDDREVLYFARPALPLSVQCLRLPVLTQVHIGAASPTAIWWGNHTLPAVRDLSIPPRSEDSIIAALKACQNLTPLTLVMSDFNPPHAQQFQPNAWRPAARLVDALVRIPELCFVDMQDDAKLERYVLTAIDDARFRRVSLDYQGLVRARRRAQRVGSLPSPCDALGDTVRLDLRLRSGVYEIEVVDVASQRREILLDRASPGLWDTYLRRKTVSSATIDALAWTYFASGLPGACGVSELTIVIARHAFELRKVSLARVSALRTLKVAVLRPGIHFERGVVPTLVQSLPLENELLLPTLSLGRTAVLEDEQEISGLSEILEYH